jgi:hypothetical protein
MNYFGIFRSDEDLFDESLSEEETSGIVDGDKDSFDESEFWEEPLVMDPVLEEKFLSTAPFSGYYEEKRRLVRACERCRRWQVDLVESEEKGIPSSSLETSSERIEFLDKYRTLLAISYGICTRCSEIMREAEETGVDLRILFLERTLPEFEKILKERE